MADAPRRPPVLAFFLIAILLASAVVLGPLAHRATASHSTASHSTASHSTASHACQLAQLAISAQPGQAAVGQVQVRVTVENISAATCALSGFPTLALYNATQRPVDVVVDRTDGPLSNAPSPTPRARTAPLAPHALTAFDFAYSQIPPTMQACPVATTLTVSLDHHGPIRRVTLPIPASICSTYVLVSPFLNLG